MRELRIAVVLSLLGCTTSETAPVARSIEDAAAEAGVPADLMMAVAVEERGIRWPAIRDVPADAVHAAGVLELRHGKLDTLALGAQLVGASEAALETDTDLGTRAGARVLAELGRRHGARADLASWRPALEALSGLDPIEAASYASRVFRILRAGGAYPARDGETIRLAPHYEIAVAEVLEVPRVAPAASDYPGAIWVQTSCTDKCTIGRPLGNASVNKIVIHDTEGDWDASLATLQNDPGKSVHYLIDADGSRVAQFRPETDTTWHAGNYFYNETSIGIEHVGHASDPTGYAAGLYATSRDLVQNIRTRWHVPLDRRHIVGHYQIPDGNSIAEDSPACSDTLSNCEDSASYGGADHHRDPGFNWQWCQYMEHLGGSCTCNDAWDHWNCTTDLTEAVRCANGVVEIQQCTGGCDVMPIGTDDVCHTDGSMVDAGVGDPDGGGSTGGGDDTGGGHHGGCTTGHGSSAIAALGILLALRRRSKFRG
jgi:N-acetyl-anhydromuramyl-L-alanine amidase AmpD